MNVNSLTNVFLDQITDTNVMAPIHRLTQRELNLHAKPRVTRGILKSIDERNKIYKKFLAEKEYD